jgi:hypothetical protein
MSVKTVYSTKDSVEDVVSDLLGQPKGFEVKALIFFASTYFDTSISEKISAAFGNATVFGCTTAGEIVSGKC